MNALPMHRYYRKINEFISLPANFTGFLAQNVILKRMIGRNQVFESVSDPTKGFLFLASLVEDAVVARLEM